MRYYSIRLINPQTNNTVTFSQSKKSFADDLLAPLGPTWTSHNQLGVLNPGALNVELDIPAFTLSTFAFGSQVRIWGVGLEALSQASNLSGLNIELNAGMLPPYNLNQTPHGQIIAGQIFQAFGNWEGVNQHIDLVLSSLYVVPYKYADISFSYKANTSLVAAIKTALQGAFGKNIPIINTSNPPPIGYDVSFHHNHLTTFCQDLLSITKTLTYSGVQFAMNGNTVYIFDDNSKQTIIDLNFHDLIGQPTWIDPVSVQFASVMRSDIVIGSEIKFPPGIFPPYVLTTPSAAIPQAPAVSKLSFQGKFTVIEVHHYGNFRQADATSWRTEYKAVTPGVIGSQLPASLFSYSNAELA